MNSKIWIGAGAVAFGAVAWFFMSQGTQGGNEVEYKYSPVKKGELLLSRSATGVLVPLTVVDVKSKAGGIVEKLAVEEGTKVKTGDLVAVIDPRDTQSVYQQAQADATAAEARVSSAKVAAELAAKDAATSVHDAEVRVKQAEIALARAQEQARVQPTLSKASINNAEAALAAQQEALKQLKEVDIPQRRQDAQTAVDSAKTARDNAKANLDRQQNLYDLGYAPKSAVESAQTSYQSAQASYASAQQRLKTLEAGFQTDISAAQARVNQAQASLKQAQANSSQVTFAEQDLASAKKALELSKVALKKAQDDKLTVESRKIDIDSAQASAVRSKVSMENAKVQLDSTRVTAPRDGVVTMKYLEEGTIIPPGTSTFSQGTSIVQIADTTRMFVECTVDEADIASVKLDQKVRIVLEAYPGKTFDGVVRKVFPAAETANNLTSIKVRVEILDVGKIDDNKFALRPGMNATCEFVLLQKEDVLIVPEQAIEHDGDKAYVMVKSSDPLKPEKREVKLGASGNEGVEVVEGLKEGDEIVTAKLDLAALREREAKMAGTDQPGGLGAQRQGGPSKSRASSGGGGG